MSAEPETPANRIESLALTVVFTAISVGLLAIIGLATRSNPRGGWWTQPWLMPAIALGILVAANIVTLWRELGDLRKTPPDAGERTAGRAAILRWALPLEFLGYYAGYVWAIQHAGYGLSTAGFILLLLLRAGLSQRRWLLAGLGLLVFMLAVFRVGLGVWMPAPDLYDLFPGPVRTALIRWF